MMNFLEGHLAGCSASWPCVQCRVSDFLRGQLSTKDFETLATILSKAQGLDSLDLKPRTRNALRNVGIDTLDDLDRWINSGRFGIPNFGRVSEADLFAKLSAEGLEELARRLFPH